MATLDEIADDLVDPIHLFLCGPSKVGKTDYIVDMLLDGFTVVYIDNDNGANTLRRRLKDKPEVMRRCHYIRTQNIWDFCLYFFARNVFMWNESQDQLFNSRQAGDNDKVLILKRKEIPFGVIFVFDSWTSICLQLLADSAEKNNVTIEDFKDAGRDAYGTASRRANTVLMNIQSFPHHCVFQGHPDNYERREAPKGKIQGTTEKDMIIKENVQIPWSVSRPHGFQMAKFFNEFGWLAISPMGTFKLDFRQLGDRVGGGSPMKEGDPKVDMRFSKLFGGPKVIDGTDWIVTRKASELKEEEAAEAAAKAAAKATNQAAGKPATALASKGMLGNK